MAYKAEEPRARASSQTWRGRRPHRPDGPGWPRTPKRRLGGRLLEGDVAASRPGKRRLAAATCRVQGRRYRQGRPAGLRHPGREEDRGAQQSRDSRIEIEVDTGPEGEAPPARAIRPRRRGAGQGPVIHLCGRSECEAGRPVGPGPRAEALPSPWSALLSRDAARQDLRAVSPGAAVVLWLAGLADHAGKGSSPRTGISITCPHIHLASGRPGFSTGGRPQWSRGGSSGGEVRYLQGHRRAHRR